MPKENDRIFEYMLKTAWLHVEDALAIGKIKLFAGSYQRGNKEATETAVHYVDVDSIRPLLHDLSWGKPVEFTDFKGTAGDDSVVSRVLRVNTDKEKGKVWFSLASGPGKETDTGAVTPAGKATKKINVGMTLQDARQMAYAVLEYMLAWRTAQLMTPTRIDIAEVGDDLFGEPAVERLSSVGQVREQHNGNGIVKEETAVTNLYFLDKTPCPEELKGHFLTFLETYNNMPPRSKEHLIQFVYR